MICHKCHKSSVLDLLCERCLRCLACCECVDDDALVESVMDEIKAAPKASGYRVEWIFMPAIHCVRIYFRHEHPEHSIRFDVSLEMLLNPEVGAAYVVEMFKNQLEKMK